VNESNTLPGTLGAFDTLPLVYHELRAVAARHLARCIGPVSLDPTVLVHEACLCLAKQPEYKYRNPGHVRAIACMFIRRYLSDYLRARRALKNGGQAMRVVVSGELAAASDRRELDLLAVSDALDKLERIDPERARIVELYFYGGFTLDQIAADAGTSPRALDMEWAGIKAWLRRELAGPLVS